IAYRAAWTAATLLTLFFSVFLAWQLGDGGGNCHCLGEIIEMSPLQSLLKNAVLLMVLLFIRKTGGLHFRYSVSLAFIVSLAALAVPFIISPPDYFYRQDFRERVAYDQETLEGLVSTDSLPTA